MIKAIPVDVATFHRRFIESSSIGNRISVNVGIWIALTPYLATRPLAVPNEAKLARLIRCCGPPPHPHIHAPLDSVAWKRFTERVAAGDFCSRNYSTAACNDSKNVALMTSTQRASGASETSFDNDHDASLNDRITPDASQLARYHSRSDFLRRWYS